MINASDHIPTAEEIVTLVRDLSDRYEAIRLERDELLRRERLLEELPNPEDELMIVTTELPSGRRWSFIQDAQVLAVSPDLDADTEAKLMAQVEKPRLIACDACGAPVWSNADCGMHRPAAQQGRC